LPDHIEVDVLIAGGGPAGAAAALSLLKAGKSVMVVHRGSASPFLVGETLPPGAMPFLQELGVQLSPAAHLPCCGIRSMWGSGEVQTQDFIFQPFGVGYHLDRKLFDAQLLEAAAQQGAQVLTPASVLHTQRLGTHWETQVQHQQQFRVVKSSWLIDATGRARKLSRILKREAQLLDEMSAFYAMLDAPAHEDLDDFTSLEAVENGWWYTARLANKRRIVAFHSELSLLQTLDIKKPAHFFELLNKTQWIGPLVNKAGYQKTIGLKSTSANSSLNLGLPISGMLAAGDSLMTFDPLSGQGITNAFYTGILAGKTIVNEASDRETALKEYKDAISTVYSLYLRRLHAAYGAESRWPGSVFWQRKVRQLEAVMVQASWSPHQ
jgi:flavin-dependent dehydrogenase